MADLSAVVRRSIGAGVWQAKTLIAEHPTIAIPLSRLRGHGQLVDEHADIVMEAFVRSALSYAVAAFRLAQEPDAMNIAHHTHSPSALIDGVRHRKPTLLIVRPPQDAVLSYVVKTTDVSVRAALQGYIRFHRPLLPYGGELAVARFDEITTDFGIVIRRINDRFGTAFKEYDRTDENEKRIKEEIDADWKARARTDEERERGVPRPSDERDELKTKMAARLHDPKLRRTLEGAQRLYRTLSALARDD
ncbi:MAG: hypothetical protein ACJ758_10045 [Actinomycetota bacterium]